MLSQAVMFKVNVGRSEFNENMQMVVGTKVKENETHITVHNFARTIDTGREAIRTYRKDRIVNGKSGILRMNF